MGVRQRVGRAVEALRGGPFPPVIEMFPAASGEALRADVDGHAARTNAELTELRAQLATEVAELRVVIGALQEQIDRWADGCTATDDALSERLMALECAERAEPEPG